LDRGGGEFSKKMKKSILDRAFRRESEEIKEVV